MPFYALRFSNIHCVHLHPCSFSKESSAADAFVQLTFCLQQHKVSKKYRSQAMLFIQLSGKFSRVLLVFLGTRLRPAEQLDKLTLRGTSSLLRDN
jgi:hypothetical protein